MTSENDFLAGIPDKAQPSAAPVLYSVADTDPDAEAGLRTLSKSTGIPVEALREKSVADEARRADAANRNDSILRDSPKTAGFLQNPVAAAVAHDDVEGLSFVERIISGMNDLSFQVRKSRRNNKPMTYNDKLFAGGIKPLVTDADFRERAEKMFSSGLFPTRQEAADAVRRQISGFVRPGDAAMSPGRAESASAENTMQWLVGVLPSQVGRAWRGISQNVGDMLGLDQASAQLADKQERTEAQANLSRPDFGGDTANAVASGAESLIQQTPALVAGVASGGVAPTLAYLGAMTYGQNYSKYRNRGASTGMAMLGAGGEATVEVLTEKLPMGETLRALESATGGRWKQAATSYLRSQLQEQQGEQVATLLQDAIDTAIANPGKTWSDYLAERPDAAYQTMVATLTQSALMAGVGGVARIAGRAGYEPPEQKQLQSEASAQFIEQVNQAAAASKVLARDPETFQQFVKAASGDGPVTDVYIDAQVLNQSGLADQVLAASPAAAEQFQEALATGGQVRIPVDEYAARIAPQEYAQQLLDDLRLHPEDMTRREAQEYAQSGAMQELEQAMTRIIGDKAQSDTFIASRDRVKQRVLDNLNALGRFTPQKNELDATLIAARSATRAAQLGITPEQFFDQYVLNVVAEGAGGQVLNQFAGQGALTADLDALKAAQDRVAAGEGAETVRRETGWHTGTDGKWRFEISDADARLTPAIKSLDRGGYDAADIQEVTYRKNDDGTYSVALMHAGAKDPSGFVNLDSVPEEVVRAILPDDVFAAVQRGDGEADFIGANLDDAKTIKMPFRFDGMNALPLDMVIDHPALFAAYPALRQVMVKVDPKAGIGGSLAETEDGAFVITVGQGQKQSTMLHEIQHAIQSHEGFARGGASRDAFADPRMRPGATKAGRDAAFALLAEKLAELKQPDSIEQFARNAWGTDEITKELEASYADYVKTVSEAAVAPNIQRAAQEWAAKEWYRRLAGEVEARNTQARASMSDAERRATSPQSTADVAERDQIVTFAKGLAEMVSDKPTDADLAEAQRQLDEQLAIADRMIAERGGLFAPNGEPSKLKRYQWAQVRTANFKAWFGDWENDPDNASKVVDENGEPMVVYHGSRSTEALTEFVVSQSEASDTRLKRTKDGAYFTRNPDKAAVYAGQEGSTYPVYLNISNPKMIADAFGSVEVDAAQLTDEGFDGLWNPKGFPSDEIVAIRKNQIKSATGNAGTFSGETGNILFQSEGANQNADVAEAQRQLGEQLAIADRMIAERGGLFAPNGEPSKLKRYQWAQVRTANFKAWFGDWESDPANASKVVDANGEPLVVYHGSPRQDLTEITPGTDEPGAWFTADIGYASDYAKSADGEIYEVFSNIRHPLVVGFDDYLTPTNMTDDVELLDRYDKPIDNNVDLVKFAIRKRPRYDGLIFPVGNFSEPDYAAVALDPNQIKSATGNAGTFSGETDNILSQPDGGHGPVKRGSFSPSSNTIALLKNADLSTFLHESGHYFFETDIALAAEILRENGAFGIDTMTPGQQQILRDVSALLKWHGIGGDIASQVDQWSRMDFEERRAHHEKTAESFERYLMEGKAPSIELQSVFQTFRQWLISVYKSIKDFIKRNPDAGELSDEVRAVFDRMLATEEEIKLAEQARSMIPLFADAVNAGMTPSEFAEYQKLGNEATQTAIDELQAKGIRDMKWLTGARSRMLKKLQKQAKAQRAEVRAMARMDVLSEPVYQAWNLLTSKMTDEDKLAGKQKRSESVDPAVDSLFEAIAKMGGLNKGLLVLQWGIDPKDKAESGLFGRPVMRAKDGGRSIDWMVEALTEDGYLTPDENGKGDVLDLEERFKAELRGDRQYSSIRNWEPEQLPGQGQDLSSITAARIDRASLDSMDDIPQEVIDRLESLGMTARTGGIHPDVLSEILPGWTSGDELVRALASAVPLKQAIEARTDQWMLEQYADLATPEAIERAADMAIHNDARERFLLAEHKALVRASGDKTQRQVMLTAAKDYARQLIGRQRIRDIRPSQYTAAEARAAKAAAASKDIAQKATEKRNQILSGMAARESYRAQDDVAKGLRYLKKFDSPTIRKRVSGDYVDQIEALLEKIDLRKRSLKDIDRRKSFGAFVRSQIEKGVVPAMSDSLLPPGLRAAYQAKVMERDENGELIVRDDVEQAKVLADYLDMAEARSYKDMTVEEFRGLVETIRQIEHLGRKKKSLLTARDGKTYEQKRDELVASVTANAERLPDRINRTVPNDRAEKLRGLRDFRISLRKIGMIMRLLDGNKDGGPMWDFFVRSANERGDWETEQIANASEMLTRALRPVFALKGGMRGKGIHFESIGRSLNREQRIGLALNVGNEGNLQRLLDGEGWTYADIQPVLESLTAAEWQAVQEVWDHMDSYRPLIAAIERRTVGGEPEWVQPTQFTVNTKDGQTLTLKGGYYPVKYDAEASQRAEELEDATDAKRAMNAATNTSTTHRSFVKKRSEAVVGRPLELSLSAMYSGVQDVIHDLAWREWLIDASKMISSSTLDDAIRRKYGAETPRAIRQWISDIAAGTRKPRGVFDRAAAFLRKNVAASGLALNFMNAVQNVTGLQNSIERIGAKWLAVGQGEYLSGPKDAAAWVHEKSSFMEHRARTQFRDLNELRNVVESGDNLLTKAKNNQFILITMTQKMVDLPTWIGAYRKAEAEGAVVQLEDGSIDDSKAVAMADQAVIDAQGSGMIKDLSAVERGGELAKLFTAYYSYMNTTYNLAANRVSGARGGSPRERGAAALHLLTLMAVPVMLMAVLKAGLTPGDDDDFDDPEKLAKKLAMEQASFAMGLIPFAREFTPMIQPFLKDQTFGYQGPAGLRIIGDATKFTQQAAQGEFDDGFRKAAVGMSGSLFGLPAAQINRTWTGVEALADDKTDNPAALMFGYQEKK